MTPAWIVCAWPAVWWQADATEQLHLVHLGTQVMDHRSKGRPCRGQTLWGKTGQDQSAGVAWDWVEVEEGVLAMADPMGVISNLKLVNAQGATLSSLETAIRLNGVVHDLPWQDAVQRTLHGSAN